MQNSAQKAFTLIELSIVLVIVALLAGGIVAGRTLVHMYELRAMVSEVTKITITINTFRDKFKGYPGDLTNATNFWGAADNGDGLGSDCGDVETTDGKTCNGNGDGQIDAGAVNGVWEKFRMWQQLADAGLIPDTYSGAPTAGAAYIGTGRQWPAAKLKPAGYELTYWPFPYYNNPTGHFIKIAARATTDLLGLNGAFISPDDAVTLDTKLDDGYSNSGRLVAIDSIDVAGCVTNGTTYTPGTVGSYMTPSSIPSCRFYFFMGF